MSMASKPLNILKKGLSKFKTTTKARKDELNAKLACKETISSFDEKWLDSVANTVDEQHVLDALEATSDYKLAKVAGNKRKRTCFVRMCTRESM